MFEKEIMQDIMNIRDANVRNYLAIAAVNPGLPTIANVSREIIGDDTHCRKWGGIIGESRVREYIIRRLDGGLQYIYKDDTEPLEAYMQESGYTEEQMAQEIAGIHWQKAVFLDINAEFGG